MDYGNPPIISVKSSGRIPIFGYRNMFAEVEENDVLQLGQHLLGNANHCGLSISVFISHFFPDNRIQFTRPSG